MKDQVLRLMEGAYDVHLHAMPGVTPCRDTIVEIAEEAKSYGMKGLVYKDLHFSTAPQAAIVSALIPEVNVIGGVTLGAGVGGLNPWAVEATFRIGGKVVWMFALDSAYSVKQILAPGNPFPIEHYRSLGVKTELGGYSVFHKGTEDLKDEAREIISLCKQYDCVMETSHLSPQEVVAVIKESKKQGFEKIVVTHANQWAATPYPVELQKELAEMGAVIMYCFENHMPKPGTASEPLNGLGKLIRQVGVDKVVLGTDFGLKFWPSSVQGMRMMIASLLADKFTEDEIARMVKTNADRLYGN
ncbi:Zn-dependent dipeptidase, dipeptidase homolog [Sporobacter termitidis DSM 10068]|uniref:Zn-dependent dipeptidase, dipeptidase homolog n=1 Tax=Sporobacter termitidis DSM 10068 TaxID=1123282 RepID=A0A1M5XWL1_9FIRM|nr:DUF6282 family protein [Sporobacter termitidis]SHI04112.1 Zn-dependent dipeptidase, dipeptidase homolog [Sporobacter termitidis DSM 10068]